ncbi:MAG: PfkB family carbohydrate kinase [Limisphaerales bacterium]
MSLLVFGSTALDSISTPKKKNPRLLGGSGSHAAVAASFFVSPKLIGVVGTDFPRKYMTLFKKHKVNLKGVKVREGRTFHWAGEYEVNMNNRRTLDTVLSTELGVVEGYSPVLPAAHRKAKYVLLANNPPGAQEAIIDQLDKPKFIVADTMDLWMNVAMNDLRSLLKRVDMLVLNDSEARQLTGDDNVVSALPKLHKFGPRYVIVKKGEHGAILSSKKGLFVAPAFPLEKVEDPTGAGDSFVGAMVGYLAKTGGSIDANIRKAILYGSVVASFCCEGFGLNRTTKTTRTEINKRLRELEKITRV